MYNIKGPSKIVTKTTTRRGISQTIDNYRDHNKNKLIENDDSSNVPKPIFHKKSSPNNQRQENISPQHEEIIKFIHESWNSVCLELDQENGDSDGSASPQSEHLVCYYEDEPCVSLQEFKPFDLESWWGKRLYAYITSSVNTKKLDYIFVFNIPNLIGFSTYSELLNFYILIKDVTNTLMFL